MYCKGKCYRFLGSRNIHMPPALKNDKRFVVCRLCEKKFISDGNICGCCGKKLSRRVKISRNNSERGKRY